MKVVEIKAIAKKLGLKVGKLNKAELIRAIQQAEGNPTCFASGKLASCDQLDCLWRSDCS